MDIIALGQDPGETGDALAKRTREHVQAAQRAGHVIRVAVLSCSDAVTREARMEREVLARTLTKEVTHSEHGHLLLLARRSTSQQLQRSLRRLAAELSRSGAGTSIHAAAVFDALPDTAARPR